MDFSYISETFIKALAGIPVTLGIMIVSILISLSLIHISEPTRP